MMDNRIEEMRNDLSNAWHSDIIIGDKFKDVSEKLTKLGYRKVPEGAVVLTREEYSDYLVMKDTHQNAIERCEKLQADNERLYKNIGKFKDAVRKETAEKFAERAKTIADLKLKLYGVRFLDMDDIDEICKELVDE